MSNLEFFFSYYLGRKLDPSDPPYVYVALTTLDSDNGAFFPSNAVHGTKRMGWIDGGAYFHSEERGGEIGDEDLLTEEEIKKLLVEMGLNLNDAYVKLAREHEAEDGFGGAFSYNEKSTRHRCLSESMVSSLESGK